MCPFTQKVVKFCEIMTKRGHKVFHYGHPDSQIICYKHFDVVSKKTYEKDFGDALQNKAVSQSVDNETHREFNRNAAKKINENIKGPKEFVFAFWGFGHKECCDNVKGAIVVEASIGYDSYFAKYKVFETYSQMTKLQANQNPNFTDAVIYPGFDSQDFLFSKNKDDYIMFLGRMVDTKGILIADALSRVTKTPIKFVGPQDMNNSLKRDNPYAQYIDTVGHKEKAALLSKAKALIMPSLNFEPCGWTNIESLFCGTPILSTDWGGMTEINIHGITGFRCRSLNDFCLGLKNIEKIDPFICRQSAVKRFDINNWAQQYEKYCLDLINFEEFGGINYVLQSNI